jgi:hypothetical protein
MFPTASQIALFPFPQGDRRSPIAVAADRPIAGIFEPFSEPAVLDVTRHPVDLFIGRDDLVLDLLNSDKPRRDCLVDQRRVGSPAKRISVANRPLRRTGALLPLNPERSPYRRP